MNIIKAKALLWSSWLYELDFIKTRRKCQDYGKDETIDTLWDKLPEISKQYWIERAA